MAKSKEVRDLLYHALDMIESDDNGNSQGFLDTLKEYCDWRKQQGHKIGFINGCFDLLHDGHKRLIDVISNECEGLIVAVNSDASVRKMKGAGRPIMPAYLRRGAIVEHCPKAKVIFFSTDDDLCHILKTLHPDIIAKQPEYEHNFEANYVRSYNGSVMIVPRTDGISTGEMAKMLEDKS